MIAAAFGCVLVAALSLLTGCGGSDMPPPPPPSVGSATIDSAGGTVTGPDGVSVSIPAGALAAPVTVRIARNSNGAPPLPPEWTALSAVYEVTPHGMTFDQPLEFRVPVDANAVPAGAAPLLAVAQPGGGWTILDSAASANGLLRAGVSHFSYVVAIIGRSQCGAVGQIVQCFTNNATLELVTPAPLPLSFAGNPKIFLVQQPSSALLRLRFPAGVPQSWMNCAAGQSPRVTAVRFHSSGGRIVETIGASLPMSFLVNSYDVPIALDGSLTGLLWFTLRGSCHRAAINWLVQTVDFGEVYFRVAVPPPAAAPTISQQPAGLARTAGQSAAFSVVASATDTLLVGWERSNDNGTSWTQAAAPAAGGQTYTIAAVALADNGAQFRAIVCNAVGNGTPTCIRSQAATLTVTPASTAPAFTTQPASLTIVEGQTASLTAVATGEPAPTLRWFQVRALPLLPTEVGTPCTGSNGQTSCTFTTPALAAFQSGIQYYAEASNSAGSVASSNATITVQTVAVAPTITTQPADVTVAAGASATFSVAANGTAPLSYQWRRNGTAITGATASSYTLANAQSGDNGARFSVVVSNGAGSATSNEATLTVTAPTAATLSLYAGSPTTFGSADGDVSAARFNNIYAVQLGTGGNLFAYEAIGGAFRLRKITPAGQVSTLAIVSVGGVRVNSAARIAATAAGGVVTSVSSDDGSGNRLVELVRIAADGTESRLAVTGLPPGPPDPDLHYDGPVIEDGAGGYYAVLQFGEIGRVSAAGAYTALAGEAGQVGAVDARGASARFGAYVSGMARTAGGLLIVADTSNELIRTVSTSGDVATLAGAAGAQGWVDSDGAAARFFSPTDVAVDTAGNAYVSEGNNCSLRKVTPAGRVSTVVGTPGASCSTFVPGSPGVLTSPSSVTVNAAGTRAYIGLQFAIAAVDIP